MLYAIGGIINNLFSHQSIHCCSYSAGSHALSQCIYVVAQNGIEIAVDFYTTNKKNLNKSTKTAWTDNTCALCD